MKYKILFIGLEYHNYTKQIINTLENSGYSVKFYSIKPRKIFHKILQTISPRYFQLYLNKYHLKIIEKENVNKYDIVLFLQVHYFNLDNFTKLKRIQKNAKFILYNWDSLTTHDYSKFISYFDKAATFDKTDAKKLTITYLPLFCIPQFYNLSQINRAGRKLYFVGNIYTVSRYEAIQSFKKYCDLNNIQYSFYLKCSPVVFFKLILRGYFPVDVSFKNLNYEDFINLVKESSFVFDFPNHSQNGFTMRFIENLCSGIRIITSNKEVLNESFYDNNRIFLYEDLNFDGVKSFMESQFLEPNRSFAQFHIENFVKSLLDINKENK